MWKKSYRDLFFMTNGKVLGFGLNIGQFQPRRCFELDVIILNSLVGQV
jgi:hypothetical protein